MNKLTIAKQVQVISALIEGNSIASTVRMTGIAKTTILRLIRDFAVVCERFHDERVQGLNTKRLQMDEVWAFVGAKEINTSAQKKFDLLWGDAWTWTAIDADSKLMVSWFIGPRTTESARRIMNDVACRLTDRIQLTTDGLSAYRHAAADVFHWEVDFAQLIKLYGKEGNEQTRKYSPPTCIGIEITPRTGNPDPDHISTSYVERSNLTLRMGMRRYTRLTNGHSEKFQNHVAMTSIFMTVYNWCRTHQTLKMTPAMKAGLTEKRWDLADLVELLK